MDRATRHRRDQARRVARGRAVLLATVEPVTRAACVGAMAQLGMSVSVVGRGVDAVVAARYRRPDLLLIDAQLEDVPGVEAIGWLRGNPGLADRPMVLMVDSAADAGGLETKRPLQVLHKPVSETALIDLIGALLAARGEG